MTRPLPPEVTDLSCPMCSDGRGELCARHEGEEHGDVDWRDPA